MDQLKVLFVSSECAPYAKSGGLGDIIGSLPKALLALGIDARVVMPKYKGIDEQAVEGLTYIDNMTVKLSWRNQYAGIFYADVYFPTYFIDNEFYFHRDGLYGYGDDYERFAFFSKAVLEMLFKLDFVPDIIHLNDWQTGFIPIYLKNDFYGKLTMFKRVKTVFTIHNLKYQGVFDRGILETIDVPYSVFESGAVEFNGMVSFMKSGLIHADKITTVSMTYANEVKMPYYGYGMDGVLRMRERDLTGILNGIDFQMNDPKTDSRIFEQLTDDVVSYKSTNKTELQKILNLPISNAPLFSIVSRLVDQKGLDLIAAIFEELIRKDIQVVILGTGEARFEHMFRSYQYRFPTKVSANIRFDDTLAQRIYCGSDFFLMPSLFEPCGLSQMFSLRYGTIPIARRTGGLNDTVVSYNEITGEGNGFMFDHINGWDLFHTIEYAISVYNRKPLWDGLVENALRCDFSWSNSARQYENLYKQMMGNTP